MLHFKLMDSPEKEVLTEMEVDGDTVIYRCPECGQQMIMGINGNSAFSVSYPDQSEVDFDLRKVTNHRHKYPIYLDVEYFSSQGMNPPAIEFTQAFKKAQQEIKDNLEEDPTSLGL